MLSAALGLVWLALGVVDLTGDETGRGAIELLVGAVLLAAAGWRFRKHREDTRRPPGGATPRR